MGMLKRKSMRRFRLMPSRYFSMTFCRSTSGSPSQSLIQLAGDGLLLASGQRVAGIIGVEIPGVVGHRVDILESQPFQFSILGRAGFEVEVAANDGADIAPFLLQIS